MIRVGVTGGIGAGKSVFCGFLEEQGARRCDLDQVGRRLLDQDPAVRETVVAAFGADVYEGGTCNRALVAERAFRDTDSTYRLERILHPAIENARRQLFDSWRQEPDPPPVAVGEGAVILEAGTGGEYDCLVLVTAPEEERFARAQARGTDPADLRRRMERQWPDERKAALVHFVVDNSGDLEHLRNCAAEVYRRITSGDIPPKGRPTFL